MLHERVKVLTGKVPSEIWIKCFLQRHCDKIVAAKGRGLNPKQAQAFNPTTVKLHFDLLGSVLQTYNVQPQNIYNVNEKGLQLGGGRKNLHTQFIFRTLHPSF
jgi:hypothetical protein